MYLRPVRRRRGQLLTRKGLILTMQVDTRVEVGHLEDALLVDVESLGKLVQGGRTVELVCELVGDLEDARVHALDPAGLAHEQRVTQMVAQLSVHDGRGIGGEAHTLRWVKALRRFDEPEVGHLKQILVGLLRVAEALQRVMQKTLVSAYHLLEGGW